MDDLSFEEFEIEYKYLKAVIEGGMETRPDNVLIYATSNRRHLIKETWKDRCMTIFGYSDGTAQVFDNTQPFMTFNTVAEAVFTLNKMQSDYDKEVAESNARWRNNSVKIDYCSLENYYGRTGVYYGD